MCKFVYTQNVIFLLYLYYNSTNSILIHQDYYNVILYATEMIYDREVSSDILSGKSLPLTIVLKS